MKTLIIVPLHIKHDRVHLEKFLSNQRNINSALPPDNFYWYVDANGCDQETVADLQQQLTDIPNLTLHCEEQGGRHLALNRGLDFARQNNFPISVFLNDDVEVITGTLEGLVSHVTQGEKIVGALSTPYAVEQYDLDAYEGKATTHLKNSISLLGELAFYNRAVAEGKVKFRGDCFAMETDYLDAFPNIHSDDTFLRIIHWHREKKDILVAEGSQVFRTHEVSAKASIRRMVRYIEGRKQLGKHFSNQSGLSAICAELTKTLSFESVKPKFEGALARVRQVFKEKKELQYTREEITSDPEFRLALARYGDIAMLYMALKASANHTELSESNTIWRR